MWSEEERHLLPTWAWKRFWLNASVVIRLKVTQALIHSRPDDDCSIQLKRRQSLFFQTQLVPSFSDHSMWHILLGLHSASDKHYSEKVQVWWFLLFLLQIRYFLSAHSLLLASAYNPCTNLQCSAGQRCVISEESGASCVCRSLDECSQDKGQTVCGSDGRTYLSRCHLEVTACNNETSTYYKHTGNCLGMCFIQERYIVAIEAGN